MVLSVAAVDTSYPDSLLFSFFCFFVFSDDRQSNISKVVEQKKKKVVGQMPPFKLVCFFLPKKKISGTLPSSGGKGFHFSPDKKKYYWKSTKKKKKSKKIWILISNFFLDQEKCSLHHLPGARNSSIPWEGTLSTQNTSSLFNWLKSIVKPNVEWWIVFKYSIVQSNATQWNFS